MPHVLCIVHVMSKENLLSVCALLLGDGSENTLTWQPRIVGCVIFYATSKNLTVKSTMFPNCNIKKYT
jgi:hypothetical protein